MKHHTMVRCLMFVRAQQNHDRQLLVCGAVVWQINVFMQTRNGSGKLPLHMGNNLINCQHFYVIIP